MVAITEYPVDEKGLAGFLQPIDFADCYAVRLGQESLSITDIYLDIFTIAPDWVRWLFILRNKIVGVFGLHGASSEQLTNIQRQSSYSVGDTIGFFQLYHLEDDVVVAGGDDKHLDFRVVIEKQHKVDGCFVSATTLVKYNHLSGRIYIALIKPFHKLIVKRLLKDAGKRWDRDL